MKRKFITSTYVILILIIISCNRKKLTEVVEVPLPSANEKITLGIPDDAKANDGSFQLEKLPFFYNDLVPNLSEYTLENHYAKHYLLHTNKLNEALAGSDLEDFKIEELLPQLDTKDENIRNNAAAYYNHSMYFKNIGPNNGEDNKPKDTLALSINADFGTFENFTTQFKDNANKLVGSGWVWLIVNKSGKLQITTTQNHDNPLLSNAVYKGKPILALDVWEHAYYLDYQYNKKKYIDAFFNVINWRRVEENYEEAIKK